MKTTTLSRFLAHTALLVALAGTTFNVPADSVTVRDGQLLLTKSGIPDKVVTNEFDLSPTITVFTNATFSVAKGKPRALAAGEILDSNGLLTEPNGAVGPVEDYYAMINGRILLVENGVPTPIDRTVRCANGASITPQGWITTANGRRTRVLDGQWIKLDGTTIAARDSFTLVQGKVVVQKDGSLLNLAPSSTMYMNDGTKVSGDGTYTRRDRTVGKLKEGEVVVIEGAIHPRY
jgi:hypothetical protein